MKKVIKCNEQLNSDNYYTELSNKVASGNLSDELSEELDYGYRLRHSSSDTWITKPRPYDDAEYYWAKFDMNNQYWKIVYRGRVIDTLNVDDVEIDYIVDLLETLNSSIKPKIIHN